VAAVRKLSQLNQAMDLSDLRSPSGNRLEALRGNRIGQYSIRINAKFRLCFQCSRHEATEMEIVDYH
jgi:proteic killer suppression protein